MSSISLSFPGAQANRKLDFSTKEYCPTSTKRTLFFSEIKTSLEGETHHILYIAANGCLKSSFSTVGLSC